MSILSLIVFDNIHDIYIQRHVHIIAHVSLDGIGET
jgi:hypothetical protein